MSNSLPNNTEKWSIAVRIFHWFGALFILSAWFTAEIYRDIGLHKALGVAFLLWTIARLINRFITTLPHEIHMPKWQSIIAHITHWALYGVMFLMPIVGLLMSMYSGRETHVFGLFSIPVMVTPDPSMATLMHELHTDFVWTLLLLLVMAHIGGALHHQFIQKDHILSRMK